MPEVVRWLVFIIGAALLLLGIFLSLTRDSSASDSSIKVLGVEIRISSTPLAIAVLGLVMAGGVWLLPAEEKGSNQVASTRVTSPDLTTEPPRQTRETSVGGVTTTSTKVSTTPVATGTGGSSDTCLSARNLEIVPGPDTENLDPPLRLTFDGEALVAVSASGRQLYRIDIETGAIIDQVEVSLGINVGSIAYADNYVWVASTERSQLIRLDPRSGEAQALDLGVAPSRLIISPANRHIFVTSEIADLVVRIDMDSFAATGQMTVDGPSNIGVGPGGVVWVVSSQRGSILSIDPSNRGALVNVSEVPVGVDPGSMSTQFSFLWIGNRLTQSVTRITLTGPNSPIEELGLGIVPRQIVATPSEVWVLGEDSLACFLGVGQHEVVGRSNLAASPSDMVAVDETVWMAMTDLGRVLSFKLD